MEPKLGGGVGGAAGRVTEEFHNRFDELQRFVVPGVLSTEVRGLGGLGVLRVGVECSFGCMQCHLRQNLPPSFLCWCR